MVTLKNERSTENALNSFGVVHGRPENYIKLLLKETRTTILLTRSIESIYTKLKECHEVDLRVPA